MGSLYGPGSGCGLGLGVGSLYGLGSGFQLRFWNLGSRTLAGTLAWQACQPGDAAQPSARAHAGSNTLSYRSQNPESAKICIRTIKYPNCICDGRKYKHSSSQRSWNLNDKTKQNTAAPTREIENEKQNSVPEPRLVFAHRFKQPF